MGRAPSFLSETKSKKAWFFWERVNKQASEWGRPFWKKEGGYYDDDEVKWKEYKDDDGNMMGICQLTLVGSLAAYIVREMRCVSMWTWNVYQKGCMSGVFFCEEKKRVREKGVFILIVFSVCS